MEFDYKREPGRRLKRENCIEKIEPRVSIVTPFYNAGKYFEQTYQAIINQTFPWFEWIIVNDGSTDEQSVEIIERLAETDSRISVYHKENGGISTARNHGIRQAVTDIIIPLDADDLIVPTYIECLYFCLYYNEDYDWCYTNNVGFQNQEYLWDEKFDSERLKKYNFLVYSAAIRKSAILEVGGYDEVTKHYYEDWHLWLRLVAAGKKPVKCNLYGFWYRRLDTGVLSLVDKDPDIKMMADQLIKDAADLITKQVEAKYYPNIYEASTYRKAKLLDWQDRIPYWNTQEKKNVLFLFPWMEMGGADIFNLNVIKMLDEDKYRLSILTTMHGKNEWRQYFEDFVDDIFELPSFLEASNYIGFIDYFLKSRKIDILFVSNSEYGYYAIPWIRLHYPQIAIIDYVHMEEWYWKGGGHARSAAAMQEFSEVTYTCNEHLRQVMIEQLKCKPEHVKTLYIGTDTEHFDPEQVEEGQVRDEYKIDKNEPIILFPCRLHPQKRPFLMIEIAARLKKAGLKMKFLVVGGGTQRYELEQEVIRRNLKKMIIFAGEKKDMTPFYKDSTVTLICSIKEGLSLTAYESLAMGTPVISSDVGGQKELVTKETGILVPMLQSEEMDLDKREFPEEEVNAYVEAIKWMLQNKEEYERLCQQARQNVTETFSIQRMIENLEEELELCFSEERCKRRAEYEKVLGEVSNFIDDSLVMSVERIIAQQKEELSWKERQRLEQQCIWLKGEVWRLQHQGKTGKLVVRVKRKVKNYLKKTRFGPLLHRIKVKLKHKKLEERK